MLKIYNGHVIDPLTATNGYYDLEIEDGKITKLSENKGKVGDDGIDASGLVIAPGFCDVHVHFRDPGQTHKEDIYTGAKCAARGGFTDVVLMANTKPSVDNVETLEYVLKKGAETDINIHTCAAVTEGLGGTKLTDMETLKAHGAAGFTDDGIPIMDAVLLTEAFKKAKELNVPVSLHEEDKRMIKENGINHGAASDYYGIYGSPRDAEYKLIARDVKLAAETGVKLDVQHISSKEGVEAVRKARKTCSNIYAEVTPHHLALTEDEVIVKGANAKMNPPLRTKRDRAAIIEGIKDGTISIIATDHAPHSPEEKDVEITKAPSGIIGLETAFSVAYDNLVLTKAITLDKLIKMFTVNPRALYGFEDKGISVGAAANLTILSEKEKWTYSESLSKSVNSPFFGQEFTGKIKYTIVRGKVVYEDL